MNDGNTGGFITPGWSYRRTSRRTSRRTPRRTIQTIEELPEELPEEQKIMIQKK